jgi:hypothetical protein
MIIVYDLNLCVFVKMVTLGCGLQLPVRAFISIETSEYHRW